MRHGIVFLQGCTIRVSSSNIILTPAFPNSEIKTDALSDSLDLRRLAPLNLEGLLLKAARAHRTGKRSGEFDKSKFRARGFFFLILKPSSVPSMWYPANSMAPLMQESA